MSTGNKEYRHKLRHHFMGQMQKTQVQVSSPHRPFIHGHKATYDDSFEEVQSKEQPKKARQTKPKPKPKPLQAHKSVQQQQQQQQSAPACSPRQGTSVDHHQKQRQTKQETKHHRHHPGGQREQHQQQHEKREHQTCCPHSQQRHQKSQATKTEKSYARPNARQGGGDAKRERKEVADELHVSHNQLIKELHLGAASSVGYPQTPASRDEFAFKDSTGRSYVRPCSPSQIDQFSAFDIYSELDLMSDSDKSTKSSKTVISQASAHDLRQMVRSQIAMQNVIDETLSALSRGKEAKKQAVASAAEKVIEEVTKSYRSIKVVPPSQLSQIYPTSSYPCPHCSAPIINADKLNPYEQSHQSAEAGQIVNDDKTATSPFSISIDDVVNSKVINPMIRKLQRMYLNSLKEEMSLMEDLEKLPRMVSEVYKSTVNK